MFNKITVFLVSAFCLCSTRVFAQTVDPIVAAIDFFYIAPARDKTAPKEYGAGAKEENRRIKLIFSYWRRDVSEDEDREVLNTKTIELCTAELDDSGPYLESCPWSDDGNVSWLVYDESNPPGSNPHFIPLEDNVADIEKFDGAKVLEEGGVEFEFMPDTGGPLYGAPDSEGRIFFLRVTGPDPDGLGPLPAPTYNPHEWGTCPWPYLLHGSDDRFLLWGARDDLDNPWGGPPPRICDRVTQRGTVRNICVNPDAVAGFYNLLPLIDDWQREGLGLDEIDGLEDIFSWHNSEGRYCNSNEPSLLWDDTNCNVASPPDYCVYCPMHVALIPHASFGHSIGAGSAITLRTQDLNPEDPLNPSFSYFDIRQIIETTPHEYFHVLQAKVGMKPGWNNENTAEAIDLKVCLYGVPGAENRCVSRGKLKPTNNDEGRFFNDPRDNVMDDKYKAALFWRYFMERYSIHPGADEMARPLGVDPENDPHRYPESLHERPSDETASLAFRRSDEGIDILGQYAKLYHDNSNEEWLTHLRTLFETQIGRSLETVIFDAHTAFLLKDYITDELRWQLQWAGDFNAIDPNIRNTPDQDPFKAMIKAQPHPDPSNTEPIKMPLPAYKECCGPLLRTAAHPPKPPCAASGDTDCCIDSGITNCPGPGPDGYDHMASVKILTDSGDIDGDEYFVDLPQGGTVADLTPIGLNDYGAGYLRILPDPAIDKVIASLSAKSGSPQFRIFTANEDGEVTLVQGCNSTNGLVELDLTERCELNDEGVAKVDIPLNPLGPDPVKTILFVASASNGGASFTYSFTDEAAIGEASLDIIEPTTGASAPAVIRTTAPVLDYEALPVLVKFSILNAEFEAVTGLDENSIVISVSDGINTVELDPATDFDMISLTGGNYFATLEVPAVGSSAEFPDGFPSDLVIDMSLTVAYRSCPDNDPTDPGCIVLASDTEYDALSILDNDTQKVASQLVLDRSGSMAQDDNAKLDALKLAAKFIVSSLPDDDQLGIVAFDHDAETIVKLGDLGPLGGLDRQTEYYVPIDALIGKGCTSIGDGLFEAQSNIIESGLDSQGYAFNLMVMSDGRNTNHHVPGRYYYKFATPLTNNENIDQWDNSLPDDEGCKTHASQNSPVEPWHPDNNAHRYLDDTFKPKVSAIALGQDADVEELGNLTHYTGGILTFAPDVESITESPEATALASTYLPIAHALMSGFRSHWNHAAGWSRIHTARSEFFNEQPDIWVEDGARKLQVSVSSFIGTSLPYLRLIAPDDEVYEPVDLADHTAVFRVDDPPGGYWNLTAIIVPVVVAAPPPLAESTGEQGIFVEAAVMGTVKLFVEADVDSMAIGNTDVDNRRWVGRDVFLRAVLNDGAPVTGGTVTAGITHPDGSVDTRTLFDDGLHQDGVANDGVYGTVIRDADIPGLYAVIVTATGTGLTVGDFQREGQTSFELHDAPDGDEDGVPDFADPDPEVPDSDDDPDGDDLSNLDEFEEHTDPLNSDTDGGGEGDGSEVFSGKDPLDPSDDGIVPAMVFAVECADAAELHIEAPVVYQRVVVQQGPEFSGPFMSIYDGALPPDGILTFPATPDVRVCYRARVAETLSGPISRWSPAHCITPGIDPHPPYLTARALTSGTSSRIVRIALDTIEDPENSHLPICAGTQQSGVSDVRWSLTPVIEGRPWVPFTPTIQVELDREEPASVIWIQVRDAAGNESNIAIVSIYFREPVLRDLAMFARSTLKLNDRVVVNTLTGDEAHIGNSGDEITELGVSAKVDGIWSRSHVSLRNYAQVSDIVVTEDTVELQEGAYARMIEEMTPVSLPEFPTVDIPSSSGPSYDLQPGESMMLPPGAYGSISVKSGASLTLYDGEYILDSLNIEPNAEVILDNLDGATHLKIRTSLQYKSELIDSTGYFDTVLEYGGSQPVTLLAPFYGTYIAPNSTLYMGTAGALEFIGAFFAYSIEVHPDAVVTLAPTGSAQSDLTASCSDGVQNQGEEGIDCGGPCPPCECDSTYEAEEMYHSTGGPAWDGWNIWSNGYISTTHNFNSGPATLTVRARGESAFWVWPHMVVIVGGVPVGDTSVTSGTYQDYEFSFTATSGEQEIRIVFDNDIFFPFNDRNLIVDKLVVDNC